MVLMNKWGSTLQSPNKSMGAGFSSHDIDATPTSMKESLGSSFVIQLLHFPTGAGVLQKAWGCPKCTWTPLSPLYNDSRNKDHFDALFDYKFAIGDPNPTPSQEEEVITHNLQTIHRLFNESAKRPELLMGKPLVAGEVVPSNASGSLETLHNTLHMWTGASTKPYHKLLHNSSGHHVLWSPCQCRQDVGHLL